MHQAITQVWVWLFFVQQLQAMQGMSLCVVVIIFQFFIYLPTVHKLCSIELHKKSTDKEAFYNCQPRLPLKRALCFHQFHQENLDQIAFWKCSTRSTSKRALPHKKGSICCALTRPAMFGKPFVSKESGISIDQVYTGCISWRFYGTRLALISRWPNTVRIYLLGIPECPHLVRYDF